MGGSRWLKEGYTPPFACPWEGDNRMVHKAAPEIPQVLTGHKIGQTGTSLFNFTDWNLQQIRKSVASHLTVRTIWDIQQPCRSCQRGCCHMWVPKTSWPQCPAAAGCSWSLPWPLSDRATRLLCPALFCGDTRRAFADLWTSRGLQCLLESEMENYLWESYTERGFSSHFELNYVRNREFLCTLKHPLGSIEHADVVSIKCNGLGSIMIQ